MNSRLMGLTAPQKVHTILILIHLFVMGNRLPQKFSAFLQTRWVALLNLALVTLLCWQLAHWTWLFLAPAPAKPLAAASTTPDPARLLDTIHTAHLFGTAGHAASSAATQATTALNLKLSGVFAASGKLPAVAIINVENKGDLPFMNGDTILPGVTLEQVRPDHVVLSRGGVMEKLLLEQKGQPLALQKTAMHLKVRQEGKGRFSISRSELNQALSDPGQLANAGHVKPVPGQGMRVEEAGAGSLMSQLGLQGGDMIRQINGKPVGQAADLLQSYRANGQIRLEGTRNGQPFEYNYTVR
jgi:general secretion pathway protein C